MSSYVFVPDGPKKKILTEDMKGEESFAGSMPDMEDADDTTTAEHEMGLYTKEDGDHPREAGLGEEIEKGERKWEDD